MWQNRPKAIKYILFLACFLIKFKNLTLIICLRYNFIKELLSKEGKVIFNLKQFISKNFSNGPKTKVVALFALVAAISITSVTIAVARKTLTINVDGKEQTLVTYKGTVRDVLNEQGINVEEKDSVEPALDEKVYENETITLKTAVPITIVCGDKEVQVDTSKNTVKDVLESESDILNSNGIEFCEGLDEISPELDSEVKEDLTVNIVNVEKREEKEMETIAYETVVEKDSDLMSGSKEIKTKGNNGQKEVTYDVVYKDGVETDRKIKSSKTISEPTTEVVVQGTGTILTASRGEGSAKKSLTCSATAYSGHSKTSSGRTPSRSEGGMSTIAVDPTVIPIGSKVYVEGYGYAVAADTGGAIKGNKIDVYFNSSSECSSWGRRKVQVKIIAYPGEW